MTQIVLFHPVLGLRDSVQEFAESWRSAGHVVHLPDLYDGRVFDDYDDAFAFLADIGGPETLLRRTDAAVEGVDTDVVYAGFSSGLRAVTHLVCTRPGARGALCFHGAVPPRAVGASRWAGGVPAQVHEGELDPFREPAVNAEFETAVVASGSPVEYFLYPGVRGHLFADQGLPDEYDAPAAALMAERAERFLRQLS